MAYATPADVQAGMERILTPRQLTICEILLEEAAMIIDASSSAARNEIKKTVSCRMVRRAIGTAGDMPTGATQGSVSALGYSQSWTIGGGSVGELYLTKAEKQMLGIGSKIGARSPIEEV